MSENITFVRWLWNGLKSLTSTGFNSDKQKALGLTLLLTGVVWIVVPITSFTIRFQFSQFLIGIALYLHGYYLASREVEERREVFLEQVRVDTIKHIADRDGVDLEEAERTFEEMERWVREAREKEADAILGGLELAEVKGNILVIEETARRLDISIEEATEKVKKAKRVTSSKPWYRR